MFRVLRRGLAWLTLAAALLLVPATANGQEPDCRLVSVGGYTHSQRYAARFGPAEYRHYASGGVDYQCSDGTRVRADSAVVFESDNQVQLYGNVRFEDPDTELRADSAIYFSSNKLLRATSNVEVTDRTSGTVIRGDNLTYNQASEFRTLDRMFVYGGEPQATFFVAPAPELEQPPPPDSGQDAAPPPDPDSGQVVAEPLGPDSGQVVTEPPDPDSGQAAAEPPDPDSGQVDPPPEEEPPETAEDEPVAEAPAEAAEPADTTPPVPYEIRAERFHFEGRRYFRAGGQVEIVRDSLQAFGDSLDYDQEGGVMVVLGDARFAGQEYTLTGTAISVTPSGSRSEEIVAREDAHLAGEQVDMRAPAIRLFMEGGSVNRLVALAEVPPLPGGDDEADIDTRGLSPGDAQRARALAGAAGEEDETEAAPDSLPRPVAVAENFRLTGDFIEVKSPGQRLSEVVAVGDAHAESIDEDSLRTSGLPDFARRDWMVGDTIIARFGPLQPSDSTAATEQPAPPDAAPRLETLTGIGQARSFYRMFSTDTTDVGAETRPALHLVDGDEITIHLDGQEVVDMEVVGQTEGWHLEPLPPDSADVDSAGTGPDSAAVDTTVARPDTATAATNGAKPDTAAAGSTGERPGRASRPTIGAGPRRRRR
ncbi:MAG: LPS export ABC transporter periplasmic protein LptC [Gemmatimonadetes bacterium]|nr:LPS export ABC transporter periplasmic protein LptC [Gemmatimonadota bacterium]